MFKILIDTCVWLDLAKDPKVDALLDVLERVVKAGEVELVVPQLVPDEFARNKAKIARDRVQSVSTAVRKVRDTLRTLDDPKKANRRVLKQLSDLDMKLPTLGEAAVEALGRIEKLLRAARKVPTTDALKALAAQRALDKRAPFHRSKNSIADAVLIETYAELLKERTAGLRFVFVTHNKHDFSDPKGEHKPHPDLAALFSKVRSLYFINLGQALRRIAPALVTDAMFEREWQEEPRSASEILAAEKELYDKVWYNRHKVWEQKIELGEIQLVEKETFPVADQSRRPIQRNVWELAKRAARRKEKQYGAENLGPWDDFEWGMLNGKLSALRWVLGSEWDFLDT